MLKKIAGALVALTLTGVIAYGATDSAGGMSVGQLATAIANAITNSSVTTVAPGTSAPLAVPVAPQNGSSYPTAPQSAAPNITGTGSIAAANTPVAIPVGPLGSLSFQVSGTFSATLAGTCSKDNNATAATEAVTFIQRGNNISMATITAPGTYYALPGGCTHVNISATAYASGTAAIAWVQTGAPYETRVGAPNAAPLPVTGQYVPPQRSGALEVCHQFTKAQASSTMRAMAVSGQSTSALWLFLMDLAAAPASPSNQAATVLLAPQKMGSDGTSFQAAADFSGAPVPSTAGLVACLSTTPFPTYTAASAIGAYTGQVQ